MMGPFTGLFMNPCSSAGFSTFRFIIYPKRSLSLRESAAITSGPVISVVRYVLTEILV
jgi:hypothetical protein